MISLGIHDQHLSDADIERYIASVAAVDRQVAAGKLIGDKGAKPLRPAADNTKLSVTAVQQFMKDRGFLPGGRVDGICGYRTQSAIRLFQEHVRSVEGKPCTPDGIAGAKTAAHVKRWTEDDLRADWMPTLRSWQDGTLASLDNEFNQWLNLLVKAKAKYRAEPSPMLKLVNSYAGASDTLKVADWDFSPELIHLIGIRFRPEETRHKFDDVLILMIKGLCFKFQGSTDPGHSTHAKGAPFLTQGQHHFQFGLHRRSYHALRPMHYDTPGHGVLVVRSRGDYRLTDEDLRNGLEANGTINIHWGGKGVGRAVNRWSEGCQVITGSGYENHQGQVVECSDYVALNNGEVKDPNKKKTRGAYNVLSDVISAFSSDMRYAGQVNYMLLMQEDLELDQDVASLMQRSREGARRLIKKLG